MFSQYSGLAGLRICLILVVINWSRASAESIGIFAALYVVFILFGTIFLKVLLSDLIDEVYDCGDSLLFRNGKIELNVKYVTHARPNRVTIQLNRNTELGQYLTFASQSNFIQVGKNTEIEELISRIDQAKKKLIGDDNIAT
ncbi:MAG: hypothetical protein ACYTFY_05430 [Planctomycetota bacterium]|jgi:hypothetical protein